MRRRPLPIVALGVVAGLAGCGGAGEVAREPARAGPQAGLESTRPGAGTGADPSVSADPWPHLQDLVAGGPRAAGTPAATAAEDLVAERLRAAGWRVRFEQVRFPGFRERRPPRVVPAGEGALRPPQVRTLQYSPGGRVTGAVQEVGGRREDAGCAAADWRAFPSDAVALVRRGTCEFRVKARRAQAAGAAALLVEDPEGPVRASLREPGLGLPVVAVDGAGAQRVRRAGRATVRVDAVSRRARDRNVLAELRGTATDAAAIVAGAHLDSVPDGPGGNDNASGASALLAVAARLRGTRPRRTIRLAFWAAEELGLHGSRAHVRRLGDDLPAAYLNFDMVAGEGTPRETYGAGRPEAALREAFGGRPGRTGVGGASDHAAFARAGVPVGGVFSGDDDRCYHRACDRTGNVDRRALREVSAAAARALRVLAGRG